jgi:type III secretion protein J
MTLHPSSSARGSAVRRGLGPRRAGGGRAAALLLCLLSGCGGDEILHGLEEVQANQVLVALGEGGIQATKRREEGTEGGWMVWVPAPEAARARRILAERELPRLRTQGIAEVFGKGSMVPSNVEERALYHHALAGELSRSVQAIDGVVEARVHLALPAPDPMRPEAPRAARAAVLVKCRPEVRAQVEALAPGIRSLVAGAAEGLDPAAVSVVIAEAGSSRASPERPARPIRLLAAASLLAAALGLALAALAWRARRRAVATDPGHSS